MKEPKKTPSKKVASNMPLRVDAALVNQARNTGAVADRSATSQLEHWAKLGRVVESVLSGDSIAKVKGLSRVDNLAEILAFTQTPAGRERALKIILRSGRPTYESDPASPGFILERSPDGTVRKGRFLNRQFVAVG